MKMFQWERITRGDDQDYLWRLILIRCFLFRIYLHIFVDSDDLCQHNHPWKFVSIILWNGYWEIDKNGKKTWYGPGSILRRDASWQHQVVIDKPAITLVVTGAKRGDWGFFTPFGFIHWSKYSQKEYCQ